MTSKDLTAVTAWAEHWFGHLPGITEELVQMFITEGFLSYDDLTFMEPAQLAELTGLSEDDAEEMIACAEEWSEEAEAEDRKRQEEMARQREEAKKQVPAIFGGGEEAPAPAEVRLTPESVFGPDEPVVAPHEAPLTAAQVF